MIDFIDHIAGEGKQGRYKLTREDGVIETVKLELNDDAEQNGTPLNRNNLMALQGFDNTTTIFKSDGSIEETYSNGHKLITTFSIDGSITEQFIGEKTITKTTIFNSDGSIEERISQ